MFRTNLVHLRKSTLLFIVFVASVLSRTKAHVLEFTAQPADTVVESGQSAVLDCTVKSSHHQSSLLIQWLDQDQAKLTFIGDPYRSQLINGSLYITSVLEEERLTGSYQCMATLPNVGSIISRTAKLNVATLEGFTDEPSDNTVYVGQKAHFACHVNASPAPRIRWLKDERPLQIDELRMTILPSGALEIDEVIEADQGSYRCNATGLSSYRLSMKAALIVNSDPDQAAQVSAPRFIAKPKEAIVVEGQNISLDCAANGNPYPTIKWLKDGYAIDMNYLDSRFSLVGSTNSLRITNIKEEDGGSYQCRAENREDSLDASAVIQVQVPPRFLKKPKDVVESAHKDVELECSVYGVPDPKISWYKNGERLKSNDYYHIVNGHNLKIMGLIQSDSGIFQCFASNAAGNIQAGASLKVQSSDNKKPKKSAKKQHKLDKQQSLQFLNNLKSSQDLGQVDYGYSARHQTFQQDSSYQPPLNASSLFDAQSAFSSLKSSETNDNLGDTQSAFTQSQSQYLDHPIGAKFIENRPGPPQDLKALVVKARFVILSWKPPAINADNIYAYSVYYRQEGSERERVQNTSRSKMEEINIGSLIPNRVYHFRVVAINKIANGVTSESLSVTTQAEEHVASAPLQITAFATSPHTISVHWKPAELPNGVIQHYTVYYMETSSAIEHNLDTPDLKVQLVGLAVYCEYSVWVVAVNENGPGAPTDEIIVRTLSMPPSEPPNNITLEPSSTSVTVRWEPPPSDAQNGVITGYKLRYRKQGKKGTTITTPANINAYVLLDLEKGSEYQVKMWAMNINGTSPATEWTNTFTFENDFIENRVPDEPGPLRVKPTADRLYVVWTPPKNQNIRIRNYILGWGKGIPDMYSHALDDKNRSYIIDKLEANSEYVLSLRASNEIGAGAPVYATVRTQDELPPEPQPPLIPPVGLKAIVLSSSSVVLYWTDTTLPKTQIVRDKRYYVVKYGVEETFKSRYMNVTDLNVMIDDLKPHTVYEFSVKLKKGTKESPWSMVVTNTTFETPPNAAPRDLVVHAKADEPHLVELSWLPSKTPTSRITGYIILYTDNKTKTDREWSVQAIKGDKHSVVLSDLKPFTDYYFKVHARNSKGNGPFSSVVSYTTGQEVGRLAANSRKQDGLFSNSILLYILIGTVLVLVITAVFVLAFLCCRKKTTTTTSPDRSKKGYQKGTTSVKQPPDLWIHHDQMELKAMEKNASSNDGASSSGAMTLPRSVVGNDYDNHDGGHTNSLDKRGYAPNYMGPGDDKKRHKPISFPVDSKPPRDPIITSVNNGSMGQSSSDSTPSSRPPYPRTQYNIPRAHVTVDSSLPGPVVENPYVLHPPGWNDANNQHSAHPPPGSTYAPGMNILADSQAGKRLPVQGHPLKTFNVPAPPPISAPGTPQPKHIVRPNSSPFKKPPTSSPSTLAATPPSRVSSANPPPHTAEEVQRLQPSHSTEELKQEMANLEGLMQTLNAITANQFEC